MKQTASLNLKTHVALETLLMSKSYYYFSTKSQKYRVCKREQNERIAGFKGRTFSLSLVTMFQSCKPSILSGLHQGCSNKGEHTDSQRLFLTFSIPSCLPLFMPGKGHFKSDEVRHVEKQLPFYKELFVSWAICQNLSKIPDTLPKRASGLGLHESHIQRRMSWKSWSRWVIPRDTGIALQRALYKALTSGLAFSDW